LPLAACPTWVEPNADGLGYYHVAYSRASLEDAFAHASEGERLAILSDAAALIRSGDAKLGDVLGLVARSVSSPVAQIVGAADGLVALARERLAPEEEAAFARFLVKTYGPVARRLGLRGRPGDAPAAADIRVDAFRAAAVRGGDPGLRAAARDAARAWLKDDAALEPSMRRHVLVAAAKTNDVKLFDGLVARAHHETDKHRLTDMVFALGAFTAPELLARADALLVDPSFDLRDVQFLLFAQLSDHATREASWAFVRDNFDALASRMRSDEVSFVVLDSLNFCDEAHKGALEALAPRVAAIDGAPRSLAKAVERTARCASSAAANRASLDAFLALP